MKVVLLGMNNPVSSDPAYALYPYPPGCTGHRIWELLRLKLPELSRLDYLRGFERVNLVGSKQWDSAAAVQRAAQLPSLYEGRTIVVFGEACRRAIGLPKMLVHPTQHRGIEWRQLPHPSGRCRWYNEPESREIAASLLYDMFMKGKENHGQEIRRGHAATKVRRAEQGVVAPGR